MIIPFNKPLLSDKESYSVARIMKSGRIGGNGIFGKKVEREIEKLLKVKFSLLTTSCTHALEMSMMALKIKAGDEVILPSFSFVSAANAVVRVNAKPVFVDIEDNHFNIDPVKIKNSISRRTKAVICVHYAGFPCQMDRIKQITKQHRLFLVEDATQAFGSKYGDRFLGTIGDVGCFSFHETKNITCGEGGVFLTNDTKIAQAAEIIREKGTNRTEFLRGHIDKYIWLNIGSSFVLSDILAAMLFGQLQRLRYIIRKRRLVGHRYIEGLRKLEKEGKIILPKFYAKEDHNWHIFYFRVHNEKTRDSVLRKLKANGIEATFHFIPLHLSPYARRNYGYRKGDFPVTEKISSTLIRLPIYPSLRTSEQDYITDVLYKIFK